MEGRTYQNIVDYTGAEPSSKNAPFWTVDVRGVYRTVKAGESFTWEGVQEPGIHHIVCVRLEPVGEGFGGGFEVKD